jgi:hypothetical protein
MADSSKNMIKMEQTEAGKKLLDSYSDPANTLSLKKLADKNDLNINTVRSMVKRVAAQEHIMKARQSHKEVYDSGKMIEKLHDLSSLAFDRAREGLSEINSYQAALVGAIAIDKSYLIQNSGVVNVNVNHEHRIELSESGGMLMRELKSRNLLPATGEVIDIEADC